MIVVCLLQLLFIACSAVPLRKISNLTADNLMTKYDRVEMGDTQKIYLRDGQNVFLPCDEGIPVDKKFIEWEKAGVKFNKRRITTGGSLKLRDVKISDSGVYTCKDILNNVNLNHHVSVYRQPLKRINIRVIYDDGGKCNANILRQHAVKLDSWRCSSPKYGCKYMGGQCVKDVDGDKVSEITVRVILQDDLVLPECDEHCINLSIDKQLVHNFQDLYFYLMGQGGTKMTQTPKKIVRDVDTYCDYGKLKNNRCVNVGLPTHKAKVKSKA